jgi:hypothetical protein
MFVHLGKQKPIALPEKSIGVGIDSSLVVMLIWNVDFDEFTSKRFLIVVDAHRSN